MTVNRELTHREVERLVHGGAHDKRRLLDYWNKIYGDLPADLRHRRPCLLGPPEAFPDESAPASYFKLWPDHRLKHFQTNLLPHPTSSSGPIRASKRSRRSPPRQ